MLSQRGLLYPHQRQHQLLPLIYPDPPCLPTHCIPGMPSWAGAQRFPAHTSAGAWSHLVAMPDQPQLGQHQLPHQLPSAQALFIRQPSLEHPPRMRPPSNMLPSALGQAILRMWQDLQPPVQPCRMLIRHAWQPSASTHPTFRCPLRRCTLLRPVHSVGQSALYLCTGRPEGPSALWPTSAFAALLERTACRKSSLHQSVAVHRLCVSGSHPGSCLSL